MPVIIKAFLPEIFAVVLCLACATIGYIKGSDNCEIKHEKVQIDGVKEHGKIEEKVMALPDADLNARLNKWLR